MEQFKSIILHRKILPAGTTLQANDSLPISDKSCCLIHLRRSIIDCSADNNSCFHSLEMLAVIVIVFITIPRNVMLVDGPSTLVSLTGALIF